jgi:predicted nucleotidyltransferase
MSPRIELDMQKIREFCRRWSITEFALFGSVLREDFRPSSDIDVLVTFAPDSTITLFDLGDIEDELSEILGRKVDLVMKRGIERSPNYIRRKAILSSAEVIYAA